MNKPLRILHLEDSPNDAELIASMLAGEGLACEFVRVETREKFLSALQRKGFDLIISDHRLPSFDGLSALALARQHCPDVPYLFVSATLGEEAAIESLTSGATDYVLKQRMTRLVPAVRRAIREAEDRRRRREAEEQLGFLAYHDPLTGLGNRLFLHNLLEQLVAEVGHGRASVALLLMDLDHFKEINDMLGHHNGDQLLHQIGHRLRCSLPDSTEIARLGGDEFALVVEGDGTAALQMAQTLLTVLQKPFHLEGLDLEIKGSIGVALCPEHAHDARTLIQRADVAMYLAKRTQSGYALYAAEHDFYSADRLSLIADLRNAIERNQLALYYQPKIDLKNGLVIGVEALARWNHPDRGVVAPAAFIPLAEQTGLIKPLTAWALRQGLDQLREWHLAGFDLTMAINLSPRNLHERNLSDQIAGLLKQSDVVPSQLILELTEGAIMADPAKSLAHLTELSLMGIRLAIDDFGTGYSSLAYLKQLSVQELKIDKAFVLGLMQNRSDAAIVRAAIDVGHALGLTVVAEGVEDVQTQHGLVAIGCDQAQGYFLGRPMLADQVI
jgi:diguanylate cyclase (GGDEF)-like protein